MEHGLSISDLTLESLEQIYQDPESKLDWNLVFTTPAWLKAWWRNFGSGAELFLRSVMQDGKIIGVAPLQIRGKTASIIGNVDVCDYQDFILLPGKENQFFNAILDDLAKQNVTNLHLETIRPDSKAAVSLMPLAKERGLAIDFQPTDVSFEIKLPVTWEAYLQGLDGKQRHEIKRKMRNLQTLGSSRYYSTSEKSEIPQALDRFLKLFPESRGDKAHFMTNAMQDYFRDLTLALTEAGVVRFGTLEFASQPVAMVMYFDYNNNMYLYNSAYDPAYRSLSVGIISKAACVRDGIEKGKRIFDFLKGPENYKAYMGGREIKLYGCHIILE
ncbi:MAG TPA: GNAT family N-acetyltransferase [Dehalococcoidales bacterium]|nr:GNAT family N-acetyltransferase [Dehalococcoidales bacterium]